MGFSTSGSKIRKYRSLIPYLLNNKIQEVIVIGSAYSNHVLSFTQLLIENGLHPTLFLRGDPLRPLQGNLLLTSLFIPPSSIQWFSQSAWVNVQSLAHSYAKKQNHSTFVLLEGGFSSAALPGTLTLPLDLLENEQKERIHFDHLFIEAGTGFTASALILGLNWLKHPVHIHVILLAEDEKAFMLRLKLCHEMFTHLIGFETSLPCNFTLHTPLLTKNFGQINDSLFDAILHLARHEGFLTDPIYTAKLFMESKQLITQEKIKGNLLIHHAGGSLTLMGFQRQLYELLTRTPSLKYLKTNTVGYKTLI